MTRSRAQGSIAYSSTGFTRFFDDLMMLGLEAINLYYGIYRGEVVSRDDPDSEGQPDPYGRLTLLIPAVDGNSQLTRRVAWPIAPLAGPSYGFKSLPPVGGYVWVVFERGRTDLPIWTGGWWGDDDLSDSELSPADAHWWVTPGGHRIILDEQSGSEYVRIKHSGGALVEIDSEGSIFVTNASGQKVNVGDGADTANEPAVLGTTLKGFLEQILDAVTALTVVVPPGGGTSGVPVNAAQFAAIKGQLQRMLSGTVNVK